MCHTRVFFLSRSIFFFPKDLSLSLSLFGPEDDQKTISFSKSLFFWFGRLWDDIEIIRPLHKKSPHAYITTIMSAALTSSTFVGAKVSVAKTTTVSKRAAFSVQANSSGPKRVRIPSRDFSLFFSLFFVRLWCVLAGPMSLRANKIW